MECFLQQESFSSGDDSFVDELLNFSPENTIDDVDNHSTASLLSPLPPTPSPAAEDADFDSFLALPEEEADLEWLSHFVEDSFSQFCHAAENPVKFQPPRFRRTKRVRPTAVRSWTLNSPSLTESTTSSSPSSSATSFPYCPTDPKSKKRARVGPESRPGSQGSRKCSHCGSQKTPQWRAGPMGSKTLCNACGVRFKTGRLLPEYRPACSPTFSSVLHSNSHRKVLEMRRSKEATDPTEPDLDPNTL